MAPAMGTQAPHTSIWIATESAKISRPQPYSCEIGVRNRPLPERTPNAMKLKRQPQAIMSAGVRQPGTPTAVVAVAVTGAALMRPPRRGAGQGPRGSADG